MDVGIIGSGYMGQNHTRVYSELKDVNNIYIYDVNTDSSESVAKRYGAFQSKSLQHLLDNVDCVSICTPTTFHYDNALSVFESGVSCLIEKPICLKSTEAISLLHKLPTNIIPGVGHIERFNPIFEEIKALIKNPFYIEIKRHNPSSIRVTDTSVIEKF